MSHLEDYIHEQVEDSFIALKKIELTAYLTLIEDQETEKLDDMSSFPIHLRATFGGMLNFRENKSSISTIDTVYKQNGKLNTIDDINEQVIRDLISSAFVGDDDTVDQYIFAIRDSDNDLLSTVASVSVRTNLDLQTIGVERIRGEVDDTIKIERSISRKGLTAAIIVLASLIVSFCISFGIFRCVERKYFSCTGSKFPENSILTYPDSVGRDTDKDSLGSLESNPDNDNNGNLREWPMSDEELEASNNSAVYASGNTATKVSNHYSNSSLPFCSTFIEDDYEDSKVMSSIQSSISAYSTRTAQLKSSGSFGSNSTRSRSRRVSRAYCNDGDNEGTHRIASKAPTKKKLPKSTRVVVTYDSPVADNNSKSSSHKNDTINNVSHSNELCHEEFLYHPSSLSLPAPKESKNALAENQNLRQKRKKSRRKMNHPKSSAIANPMESILEDENEEEESVKSEDDGAYYSESEVETEGEEGLCIGNMYVNNAQPVPL
uniref:Uncharacterized protein n=1 Tax=Ditylum brightwellii TaxID=49249 RepID=A0A7S4T114_9STRA